MNDPYETDDLELATKRLAKGCTVTYVKQPEKHEITSQDLASLGTVAAMFSAVYTEDIEGAKYKIGQKVRFSSHTLIGEGIITSVHNGDDAFEYAVTGYSWILYEFELEPLTHVCLHCGTTNDGSKYLCTQCGSNSFK